MGTAELCKAEHPKLFVGLGFSCARTLQSDSASGVDSAVASRGGGAEEDGRSGGDQKDQKGG